jgi:hypothetical protein
MKPILMTIVLLSAAGCASPQRHADAIRPQAAFDLDCPAASLKFTEIEAGQTYGVEGCGKRATYIGLGGRWVQNKEDAPAATATAAP